MKTEKEIKMKIKEIEEVQKEDDFEEYRILLEALEWVLGNVNLSID